MRVCHFFPAPRRDATAPLAIALCMLPALDATAMLAHRTRGIARTSYMPPSDDPRSRAIGRPHYVALAHRGAAGPEEALRARLIAPDSNAVDTTLHHMRPELAGASLLTLPDDGAISAEGSVTGLSLENGHIAFDVSMDTARPVRLSLSSRLLRLARTVR